MGIFSKIKGKIGGGSDEYPTEFTDEYVQIDADKVTGTRSRINVRPFIVEDFSDVKPMLDTLREGYTIALVNIKPLKDRDMSELKRAVSKLKKTCDAIEGDIAGFGDDWIVITPSFAKIHRNKHTESLEE